MLIRATVCTARPQVSRYRVSAGVARVCLLPPLARRVLDEPAERVLDEPGAVVRLAGVRRHHSAQITRDWSMLPDDSVGWDTASATAAAS